MRRLIALTSSLAVILAIVANAAAPAPVADAAMARDREAIKTLLKNGADVNAAQGDGMTALHWASRNGDAELAQMLLFAGANVKATTRLGGYTALIMAAEQGHAEAEFNLGRIYSLGFPGLPQIDYHEAVKWRRRAADKGHPPSQMDLGSMYENGQGVPQDYLLAHMWYNLAAAGWPAAGYPGEDVLVAKTGIPCCRAAIVKLRDELSAKMTPSQIAEAQRMAREWLEQHPATDGQQ